LYGVGAMISPLVASVLLQHDISWKGMYVFLSSVAIINVICITVGFWHIDFEETHKEDADDNTTVNVKMNHSELTRRAILNRVTLIGAAYILVYVGVEVTLGGWGYTYLKEARGGNEVTMAQVVSGYWAGLAAGRILLGYLSSRFGEKLMITLFTVMIIGGLFVMMISKDIILNSTGALS
jgi:fucose permease